MNIQRVTRHWLPLAAVATVVCMLVYLCTQQSLRQGVNDPQIQLAEDAAHALAAGATAQSVIPPGMVDLARSLSPFVAIYDASGKPLASSGQLDGAPPAPPHGLFALTQREGEHRVTWMPRRSVRMAVVLVAAGGPHGGFAMAGRSMREVETRESQMLFVCAAAWIGALAGSLALALLLEMWLGKNA